MTRLTGRLLLGAAWLGCGQSHEPAIAFSPAEVVSTQTAHGATPMFLVSAEGQRVLSWVADPAPGEPARLYVALEAKGSSETLGSLTDPLGGITPHGEAPPQLAEAGPDRLLALYTVGREVAGRRFPASALRFARSHDGGRSWSDPVSVNEGEAFGSHNFHSLLARGDEVYAAWLSSVDGKSGVWLRRSADGGETWEPTGPVHLEATCPCCRTALALGPDGTLYAAWRKIFPGDVRDIVVARSVDRGATWEEPVRPRADGWVYPGCPHAGPSLKVGSDGVVHIAWWTGKPGEAGVYYAHSRDEGTSFTAQPIAVGETSTPAHVQLALTDSVVAVVWDDGLGELPGVLLRVSHDGGTRFGGTARVSAPGVAASFPVIGAWGDSLLVAWTQRGHATHQAVGTSKRNQSVGAPMPLPRVGQSEVLVRAGALP